MSFRRSPLDSPPAICIILKKNALAFLSRQSSMMFLPSLLRPLSVSGMPFIPPNSIAAKAVIIQNVSPTIDKSDVLNMMMATTADRIFITTPPALYQK